MLLDNRNSGYVGKALKQHAFQDSKLSVLSSLFTLYGFSALKKELKQLDSARILLTQWEQGYRFT